MALDAGTQEAGLGAATSEEAGSGTWRSRRTGGRRPRQEPLKTTATGTAAGDGTVWAAELVAEGRRGGRGGQRAGAGRGAGLQGRDGTVARDLGGAGGGARGGAVAGVSCPRSGSGGRGRERDVGDRGEWG